MPPTRLLVTTSLFLVGVAICLTAGPTATRAGERDSADGAPVEAAPQLDRIRGKLLVRKTQEGGWRLEIEVGKTRYLVVGELPATTVTPARKFVSVQGRISTDGGSPTILLGKTGSLKLQERTVVYGTVAAAKGAKRSFVLEAPGGVTYAVPRSATSKMKPFAGKHVGVLAFVVSGPGHAAVESVKSVVRKLLPGEREPDSGKEAVAGSWTGSMVAKRVPAGLPGVKAGDSFALSFSTDAKFEKTGGRLMNAYDVVGLRLRKFGAKKRTAEVELAYSFGQGSYTLTLKGTFGEDWKSFTGTWNSGFLGAGTFDLTFDDH